MLDIAGLPEFASATDDDYVANAISLLSSKDRQREARERMIAGGAALFDNVACVRALERALLRLVA